MNKLIQCVPNFSEGRDERKIEKIIDSFRSKDNVKLLDYGFSTNRNRLVATVVGAPTELKNAVIEAIDTAVKMIDMTRHRGHHPRMGAVDVVPFIPIRNVTMEETIALSKEVAKEVSDKHNLPVFLYEKSASAKHRENIASVRKGEFEGMREKMKQADWKPDFGPDKPHPTAGSVAIGARKPLIAYNINLNTPDLDLARTIARKVRHIGGGLQCCKAIGYELKERGITQVSINLTDFTRTSIYQAHEMVRMEAKRYGVSIIGSEIVGLVPMQALTDTVEYYLGLENFSINQVLEANLEE